VKRFILAITAASGPAVGLRLAEELLRNYELHLIISEGAFGVIRDETGLSWSGAADKALARHFASERLFVYDNDDLAAAPASGSFLTDGMIVAPCSMKTLSGIACGYANNLIGRAADVAVKEGRPLILSPRETPFSAIHLENMLKLARLGVKIVPPVAAFYHKPETIEDLVAFIAGKILDSAGVAHDLFRRWGNP
jgi:4-hydroxy-3-polyprenylbenzoate decarboxylase